MIISHWIICQMVMKFSCTRCLAVVDWDHDTPKLMMWQNTWPVCKCFTARQPASDAQPLQELPPPKAQEIVNVHDCGNEVFIIWPLTWWSFCAWLQHNPQPDDTGSGMECYIQWWFSGALAHTDLWRAPSCKKPHQTVHATICNS